MATRDWTMWPSVPGLKASFLLYRCPPRLCSCAGVPLLCCCSSCSFPVVSGGPGRCFSEPMHFVCHTLCYMPCGTWHVAQLCSCCSKLVTRCPGAYSAKLLGAFPAPYSAFVSIKGLSHHASTHLPQFGPCMAIPLLVVLTC